MKIAPEKTKESTHRRSSWRWTVYSPGGVGRPISHYIKLAYGVLGVCLMVYIAMFGMKNQSATSDSNLNPSSWYWSWLAKAQDDSDQLLLDEDMFFTDEFEEETDEESASTPPWGTDSRGNNVRYWMGKGAADYILYGSLATILGLAGALGLALLTIWPARPRIPLPHTPSAWRRFMRWSGKSFLEMIDNVPKFLLLIALFSIQGGNLTVMSFTLGMAVFLMLGSSILFQERFASFFASEQYLYAQEIGLSRNRIFLVHLLKRRILPLLPVQLPFMLSAFVLWESTMAYFDWKVPEISSWGQLIKLNHGTDSAGYYVPLITLLIIVSSLYLLGDALRERLLGDSS